MAILPLVAAARLRHAGAVIVCIFRSRLRPDADLDALRALDARLDGVVRTLPGFLGNRGYTAEDGEGVGIIEFESLAAFEAWRQHPEHVAAKARGREFFAEVRVQVGSVFHATTLGG
jgi:heme-degrading monooxygenase HmoA